MADYREEERINGIIGVSRTLFICILLTIGSILFTMDATTLVLNPIERMIEKVKIIAANPLAATSENVEMAGVLSAAEKVESKEKDSKEKEME